MLISCDPFRESDPKSDPEGNAEGCLCRMINEQVGWIWLMCDIGSFLQKVYENDCFLILACHGFKITLTHGCELMITDYFGCNMMTCHGWEVKQEIPQINLILN